MCLDNYTLDSSKDCLEDVLFFSNLLSVLLFSTSLSKSPANVSDVSHMQILALGDISAGPSASLMSPNTDS